MRKLLIVMTTNPLNQYYYEKYDLKRLNNQSNLKVKYWNLLNIHDKKIAKIYDVKGARKIYNKNYIEINDILHLIKEFKKLPKSFFYINWASKKYKTSIIDRLLKIYGGKKLYIRENAGYQYITYKERLNFILKNINFNIIKKIFKFPLVTVSNFIKFKIIQAKPILYFVPNKIWYKIISKNADSSKIIKIQDYDFQLFRKYSKGSIKKNFIVFIDQEMDYSFDYRINYSRKPYMDRENYWLLIDKFLSYVSKKFNSRVVIAASHRRNIYDKPIKYKFFFDKTAELIKNSKFVVSHDSTALHMAILFKKPIILLTQEEFKKREIKNHAISTIANRIGTKPINLSSFSFNEKKINLNSFLKINKYKYNEYINNQFSFKNKNFSSNWDVIRNELEKVT